MNELQEEAKTEERSVSQIQELIGLREVHGDREPESEIIQEGTSENFHNSRKLAKNPYLKLLTVALITGIGFIVIALIFSLKPSVKLNSVSGNSSSKDGKSVQVKTKEELLEEENAALKAKLAIVQQEQLGKIKEQLDNPKEKNSLIKVKKSSRATENKPRIPQTKPFAERAVNPNTRVNSQQNYFRPYQEGRIERSPLPQPEPVLAPVTIVHTYEDWQQLAQLGNYGATLLTPMGRKPKSEKPILKTSLPEEEEIGITGTNSKVQINPGQVVNGTLSTPIVWAEGLKVGCVVELQQPLINEDGLEVWPRGTKLVFQIQSVHSSGLVIVQGAKAIINGQEYPIPPEALSLTKDGGSPLMAKLENSGSGEVVRNRIMTFLTGALSKTGEVMNRPSSSSSFSGISGTSQSVQYGETNYLGSILEGGFEPLQEQMQESNEKRLKEILDRSPLWVIEKGTPVQVIVLNSFNLDLEEEF